VNLLLDTHIWIWSLNDPRRLNSRVAAELSNTSNDLWLSPISVWELLLLIERRRIAVRGNITPAAWIESALIARPMRDASLTREVALRSRSISMPHSDPADHFLAATASVYDLTLVTEDAHILAGTGYQTLSNR
jgi:PIN domain nuclease of toxin-antitoxin system